MAPDDRLSAALDEIRGLVSARDERWPGGAVIGHGEDVTEFDAAQDRLAAQVPRLLAALDGVLALADEWTPGPDALNLAGVRAEKRCAEALRSAISAALLGEEADGQ